MREPNTTGNVCAKPTRIWFLRLERELIIRKNGNAR